MKAYVINLLRAKERRKRMESLLKNAQLNFDFEFVDAIDGRELQLPDKRYNELLYKMAHGKRTNMGELGCYFSHIRALKTFLHDKHAYGIILEDDLEIDNNLLSAIFNALTYKENFDILRLSGLHKGTPVKVIEINEYSNLSINLTRQTGAGAYLVSRYAAKKLTENLLPMFLPYDHAFDRDWILGLRTMSHVPYPIRQNQLNNSDITDNYNELKLNPLKRITVLIYRTINESFRVLYKLFLISKYKLKLLNK